VLLYYIYMHIEDVKGMIEWQEETCERLALLGRIRVGLEGLNGTLGGKIEACDAYELALLQFIRDEATSAAAAAAPVIQFKRSPGGSEHFNNLLVKECSEIVTMGVSPSKVSFEDSGSHLTPHQWHHEMKRLQETRAQGGGEATVLLDCRNAYESRIGQFTGAVRPQTRQFLEFPRWCEDHKEELAGKRVLMYCTGGIRCERASAYLKTQIGVTEALQLEGGIHCYLEQFPDGGEGAFQGSNFVFDKRPAVQTTPATASPYATCDLCDEAGCAEKEYQRGHRCRYCHGRVLLCPSCEGETVACLCKECRVLQKEGKLKNKRLAEGLDRWPTLAAAGLAPRDDNDTGMASRRRKFGRAVAEALPSRAALPKTAAAALETALLCQYLHAGAPSEAVVKGSASAVLRAWEASDSREEAGEEAGEEACEEAGEEEAGEAGEAVHEALSRFAETSPPDGGCCYLLYPHRAPYAARGEVPNTGEETELPCSVLGWKDSNGCCFFRVVTHEEPATCEPAAWKPDAGVVSVAFVNGFLGPQLSSMRGGCRGGWYQRTEPKEAMKRLVERHKQAGAGAVVGGTAKQRGAAGDAT